MTLSPVSVESFGGLNLDRDPADVGWTGAIDLLDVDLGTAGTIRERPRFSSLATTTLTSPNAVGLDRRYWIASTASAVHLYNSGTLVGTAVAPAQYVNGSVQAIGTPSNNYFYLADLLKSAAVRRLTQSGVISAPAGMPTAAYLARTPVDNRLVALNISTAPTGSTATASPSLVHLSDPGAPETWGANNWVQLDPGDGEEITGAVAYGNSLYVFKYTKVYEFYGTSTDSSGNPVFNYRTRHRMLGAIALGTAPVAGPDGVYFWGYSGSSVASIFRINESGVSEVGRPIRPAINSGLTPSTFTPGTLGSPYGNAYAAGRYWLLVSGASGKYLFGFDPEDGAWTLAQMPTGTTSITGVGPSLLVAGTGTNAAVHYQDVTNASTDSLRTPTPLYRSGFSDLGSPDEERVHSWRVVGSGTPTLKIATDYGTLDTGATVMLGTAPAVSEGVRRYAPSGRTFSWQMSGSAWLVNNLTAYVAGRRRPGDRG